MRAPSPPAGYSGTPLLKKLGYRDGGRALLIAVPDSLDELTRFPGFARREVLAATDSRLPRGPFDLVHLFTTDRRDLERLLPRLRAILAPSGAIWVSWPKKSSKVPTNWMARRSASGSIGSVPAGVGSGAGVSLMRAAAT